MSYVLCLCAAYSGIHNSVLVYVCCSLFEFVQNKTKKIIEYEVANKLRPFELSYRSLVLWVSLKGGFNKVLNMFIARRVLNGCFAYFAVYDAIVHSP